MLGPVPDEIIFLISTTENHAIYQIWPFCGHVALPHPGQRNLLSGDVCRFVAYRKALSLGSRVVDGDADGLSAENRSAEYRPALPSLPPLVPMNGGRSPCWGQGAPGATGGKALTCLSFSFDGNARCRDRPGNFRSGKVPVDVIRLEGEAPGVGLAVA